MKSLHGMRWGAAVLVLLAGSARSFGQEGTSGRANEGTGAQAAQSEGRPDQPIPPRLGAVAAGDESNAGTAPGEGGAEADQAARPAAPGTDGMSELEQQVRSLKESNELLIREVDTLRREVRQLHSRLGELAGSGGAAPRNLLGQMATDEDFREDVMRAIQGEVVIHNRTAMTMPYYVNGVRWSIPPGKYVVTVPLGEVTAHLPDEPPQEFSRHWKLVRDAETGEPRRYRLWLNIGYPAAEPIPEAGVVARR